MGRHCWDMARGTRTCLRARVTDESRARARLGQGTNTRGALGTGGSVMAQAQMQRARAQEGTSRGGLEGRNEQNEHEASPPPPPPPLFIKLLEQLKGPWKSKGCRMPNFACTWFHLQNQQKKIDLGKLN